MNVNVSFFNPIHDAFVNAVANTTLISNTSVYVQSVKAFTRVINVTRGGNHSAYSGVGGLGTRRLLTWGPNESILGGTRRLLAVGGNHSGSNETAMSNISGDNNSLVQETENVTGIDIEIYLVTSSYNSSHIIETVYGGTYVEDLTVAVTNAVLTVSGVVIVAAVSTVAVILSNIALGHLHGSSSSSSSAWQVKRDGV
jgi:hypothetical protein